MALNRQNPTDRQAADWAVALDRGLTAEEETSLAAWLAADPRREGALVRARAVWSAATGPKPVALRRPAALSTTRRWMLGGGLAAGLTGMIGLDAVLQGGGGLKSARGEVRRFALEDGSEAVMNSGTRIVVRFSEARRAVDLRGGEAWFDVAKNPRRPFVVSTAAAEVTAVGTAFSVREDDGATEVIVTEGTVRVRPEAGGEAVLISAGGRLTVKRTGPIETARLDADRVRRRLAWRDGLIMLDGETLAEAAAEFNRYSHRPIRVSADLADRKVVGVFGLRDAESFARANAALLSAPIEVGADEIRLGPPRSFTETSQ